MKNHLKILLLILVPLLLFTISCRKETVTENSIAYSKRNKGKQITSVSEKQIIADWIVEHDKSLNSKDKKTLDLISNNLNYDGIEVKDRDNGDDIIIIPIKETVKSHLNLNAKHLKLDANSILNYVIVRNKDGKLRWSYIVSFQPSDGKKHSKLLDGTLQNILNNKPVADEGVFNLINLDGKLSLQLSYKNNKISAVGRPMTKAQYAEFKKLLSFEKKDNQKSLNNAPLPEDCEDFFLVTTYYDGEGGTYEDWEYLYTECDGETGGGGGGGLGTPEEDPDIEIETEQEFSSLENIGTPLDMEAGNSGPNTAGVQIPGTLVSFKAKITRKEGRILKAITRITMDDPTIAYGAVSAPFQSAYRNKPCVRYVTLIAVLNTKQVDIGGVTATLRWRYDLHCKYVYTGLDIVDTEQFERLHQATVSAYTIGAVEW